MVKVKRRVELGADVVKRTKKARVATVQPQLEKQVIADVEATSSVVLRQKKPSKLSSEETRAYFAAEVIEVEVPDDKDIDISPMRGFSLSGFPKKLVRYCKHSFQKPSAIQACCWPLIMQRSDICGIAATGSGKTLAFTLPYVAMSATGALQVFAQPCNTPRYCAIAPTRELAQQISEVCKDIVRSLVDGVGEAVPVLCIYGGVNKKEQCQAILDSEVGLDMLVATPGRLKDLVDDCFIDLSAVQYLVLDEADRILDLGFVDVVTDIVAKMPKPGQRLTCMFSATWPKSVHQVAKQFLHAPVRVSIGSAQKGAAVKMSISQEVEVLSDEKQKPARLLHHLKTAFVPGIRILIFALYKTEVAFLKTFLQENGYDQAIALQGGMTQDKREKAIASFRVGRRSPLVATDIAARGLDIKDVELVLNYTFPLTIEDFVHRVGRTGRAGKLGKAITFFCPSTKDWTGQFERVHASSLVKVLREAAQIVPADLDKIAQALGGTKVAKVKTVICFNCNGNHYARDCPCPKGKGGGKSKDKGKADKGGGFLANQGSKGLGKGKMLL